MALANFTPGASSVIAAPSPAMSAVAPFTAGVAATLALPGGGGPTLLVTNSGPCGAFVLLAATALLASAVSGINGTCVPPRGSISLAVGANSFIGAIGVDGLAILSISQGT